MTRLAAVGQAAADHRQLEVEELAFVDGHDLGVRLHRLEQFAGRRHVLRRVPDVAVRDDVVLREAVVEPRLEDLDLLARDLGPAHAADELLALAAEHAAGDDFDPALIGDFADYIH